MSFKPELLSPAGSLKNMRYAFAYGADAVYAGLPRYSLRVRNNEFDRETLRLGIEEAHANNKKFYVVVNIAPHNSKLKTFIRDIQPIVDMKPDAFIMSDPGLIMMVRENFPEMEIHLSVQSNAINWATVKFWQNLGLTRIVLSRELTIEEIGDIRTQIPDMELEVFIHGALCMAYSGRCLLSGYINNRDPNQGICTNACRWEYNLKEGVEDELGNIVDPDKKYYSNGIIQVDNLQEQETDTGIGKPTDKAFIYKEKHRPNEEMTVFEDEHGTYFMNSKDLRAVEHVSELTKMGVHSLKIEGRTKSFYYCARTAQVYRKAIDDAAEGKPFDPSLLTNLESLAHRGYTEGFLKRQRHDQRQNYEYGYSVSDRQQFVGEFTGNYKDGYAEVLVKNKFLLGDQVELMTINGNVNFKLEYMLDKKGQPISVAKGDGHTVYIEVPTDIELKYALLLRYLVDTTTRNPHQEKTTNNYVTHS